VGSNPTSRTYPRTTKEPVLKDRLLAFLTGPKTSTEIQNAFEKQGYLRGVVRTALSSLYRKGKLNRSPFKTLYGYIYALPEHKDKIIEKLQEVVPPYVKNAVQLLMTQRKIFVLNDLVELTSANDYETMEYYLDNVFARQLNWIKYSYHKSFKIYWNAKFKQEELYDDFLKELSKTYERIKVQGVNFEKEVRETLDAYLFSLPFKVEKESKGTPSGKYFFDASYKLFLFNQNLPIHLKVEIKSFIPNLLVVAHFYRKIREYSHGTVIPIMIAPAFSSISYKTFGDILYLTPFNKLKEFINNIIGKTVSNQETR